jgi:HEAT repeat protein
MQLMFSVRNVAIVTALAVGGYYGYKSFYGDIETNDINSLLQSHRLASALKRQTIKERVLSLYNPQTDYGMIVAALDQRNAVTQALAVEILVGKTEGRAVDKLLEMLRDNDREPEVKAALAKAFRVFPRKAAIPRLIELTDKSEEHDVRVSAHDTLREILSTGATIKFGEGMHQNWIEWWRDHSAGIKLQ